jgi:hypothetical protein
MNVNEYIYNNIYIRICININTCIYIHDYYPINFRYREKATAYELAPFIAGNMLTYPMNHIISAGYLLDDIDLSQVREYISKLTPTTAVTLIRSRTFDWLPDDTPSDATEPDRNTLSGIYTW